ncbi:type II toxin-antitoxin system VapC family toxin [Halorussus salinus]|uniref:type II toxin-antitoxin system VapC family toxin n=1 Tax=Halorussus salinus TaxID=1364935 RepID=UPI0010930E79|nr:PIN domain-containing protein [Halorussus salinus]
MPAAVVDSVVLLDFWDERDERRHERARNIVRGIDHGVLPTGRVTNYVVLELLNLLDKRLGTGLASDTYRRLDESAGFETVQATDEDFRRAIELFERYDGLSFGDATTVAYMRRLGIEYVYSFDADFDTVDGITRLATKENPYT